MNYVTMLQMYSETKKKTQKQMLNSVPIKTKTIG